MEPDMEPSNPGSKTPDLASRWSDSLAEIDPGNQPEWLHQLRKGAARSFREAGLPDRKVEAWRYTPLRLLEQHEPRLRTAGPSADHAVTPADAFVAGAPIIDIVDGQVCNDLVADRSNGVLAALPAALGLHSLQDGLRENETLLRPVLEGTHIEGRERAFTALNTAQLEQGLLVHVPEGIDGGQLLLRWTGAPDATAMNSFRLVVVLEAGARLSLLEQFQSVDGTAHWLNLVTQVRLGHAARLEHLRLQQESPSSALLTSTEVQQAEQSRFKQFSFDLGAGLARHEVEVDLAGSGANASLNGAYVLHGQRHADNHLSVHHEAKDCRSEQYFRGVLGGRSRGVFNGRTLIREGADGSSVEQSNANLLLSRHAEIDTKPELEIYADEVEASHGATVGQLDESAVFYLRTRGLTDAEARQMLTAAFCRAVLDRIDDHALAEALAPYVDQAMRSLREESA